MNKIKKGIISNSPCYHILKVLVQYLISLFELDWYPTFGSPSSWQKFEYMILVKKLIRLGFMKDLNGHLSSYPNQVRGSYKDAQLLNISFKFGKSFNKYGKFVEEFLHHDTLSWAHTKKMENLVYI